MDTGPVVMNYIAVMSRRTKRQHRRSVAANKYGFAGDEFVVIVEHE